MLSRTIKKRLVLSGVVTFFTFATSYALADFIRLGNGIIGILVVICAIIFFALFIIQAITLFEGHPRAMTLLILVQTGVLASPLYTHASSWWFWLFGMIAYLFLLHADRRGRALVNDMASVRFMMIGRCILPPAVTAMSILAVMFFYDAGGVLRSEFMSSSVSAAVRSSEPIMQRFFGDISINRLIIFSELLQRIV